MSRAREAARLVGNNTFTIDSSNNVGLASTSPSSKLNVSGIVSATAYYGDGSNLEGVASAGLGTAIDSNTPGLDVIYYTNQVLSVGSTITVDVPSSAKVAYTQYAELAADGDADIIIADGDDLILDILGISTDGASGTLAGGGGRMRVDNITDKAGTGPVTIGAGASIVGVTTIATVNVGSAHTIDTNGARIAGIVTTDPYCVMNSPKDRRDDPTFPAMAILGRVPAKVVGEVQKGDLMVSSSTAGHACAWTEEGSPPAGSIVGKAVEDKTGAESGVIEVAVGIN